MRVRIHTFAFLLAALLACQLAFAGDTEREKELRIAASIGDTETVGQLLDQGVPVDTANQFGKTALMMAVEGDNLDTVALLLARGADVLSLIHI